MIKIKFIKDTKLKKKGDVVNCSKKSADSAINNGYAEYVKKPIKKKMVKVKRLKEKSEHKLRDIVQVSKEIAEHLVKKSDAEYVEKPKEVKSKEETYWEQVGKELFSLGTHKERKEYLLTIDFDKLIEKDSDALIAEEIRQYKDHVDRGIITEKKPKEKENSQKIEIELPGQGILVSEFADELTPQFRDNKLLFFRQDIQAIVEVQNNEFRELKPIRFITLIEKYFEPWLKIFKKDGSNFKINKSVPLTAAGTVLASPNFEDKMPKIERIFSVQIPIMLNDKLTFPKKGYDERFNSWTSLDSPEIKTNLTLTEAKKILYKIFNEFCFQSNQDYVNAIAGLLTPNLRGLFSNFNVRTPFFGYLGNRERVGKDFCAGNTGLVYEGLNIEESPISTGEFKSSGTNDELRKKIMSAFIHGRRRLHFANNKGKLNNAVLEAALTSTTYSDRILGSNKMGVFNNEMDFSFSGNIGITLTPDLVNRTRFVRLFLDIEDANTRKFKNPNLHEWVLNNRSLILSALYTLIKNWIDKGSPKGTIPFTSFPEWANVCGGIMEAAKLGNPCVKDDISTQGISLDPDSEEMKFIFENMYKINPDEWISKKTIRLMVMGSEDDLMGYVDWDKKSDQIKFGQKIQKNVDRLYSDIRLIVKDKNKRPARWEFKFTKEESSFNKEDIFGSGNDGNDGNDLPTLSNHSNSIYINTKENTTNITNTTKNWSESDKKRLNDVKNNE